MVKLKVRLGITGIVAVLAIAIMSCPGDVVDNTGGGDARLASLAVAGQQVPLGKPAAALASANPADLNISSELMSDAAVVPLASSPKAIIAYGRMADGDSVPVWVSSGTLSFSNGDIFTVRVTAENGTTLFYKFSVRAIIAIKYFRIAGQDVNRGSPAGLYSQVTRAGSVSVTNLVAGSVAVEVALDAIGASFRTAKASGNGEPQWDNSSSPVYAVSDGDFLYIEVSSGTGAGSIVNIYKIAVAVTAVDSVFTVSGTYTLHNYNTPHRRVAIEAYTTQSAATLVSRAEANMADNTWSLQVPSGQELWFKIAVTDETGFTFGRVVSASGQAFHSSVSGISLVLYPASPPKLLSFTLINADASSGVRRNKEAIINDTTGEITFPNTSFTTVSVNTIINFHSLAASFTLSEGSKLYRGSEEQISGVSANNYYNEILFTVVAEDNARRNYTVAAPVPDSCRVAGTRSWQTHGFGIMNITTTNTTLGLPTGNTTKLNMVWNPTGSYTYISPEGRVMSGATEIRGRGNWSLRYDTHKSYNIKLNAPAGFDYYDYKTQQYTQLPAHQRWALLAHQADNTRIRTTLGWEMGRRVLTNMGWQPHGDWVFFFLNGEYKGIYILSEVIKPEEGRLGITPLISSSNLNSGPNGNPGGGFEVEVNNFYFYFQESGGYYTFDELYNFVTSHQNPVGGSANRQIGVAFSMNDPDENMKWYYPDPPVGNGYLSFTNSDHAHFFPRKGILLQATPGYGTAYNRKSNPAGKWIVPDDIGQPRGMGSSGMVQNNGGIYGTRTLEEVYPDFAGSPFVRIAQFLQDAEDAIYAREGYLNYIDIDSFIDWHIAREMASDWEVIIMNGQHIHYDPSIGKLKMGPIWDLDQGWNSGARGATPGFIRKVPFWYKELLGWEVTSSNGNDLGSGTEIPNRKDTYYVSRLKSRWNEVKDQFSAELNQYIDAQETRFARLRNNEGENYDRNPASPVGTDGNRAGLKNTISTMRNALDPVFNGY